MFDSIKTRVRQACIFNSYKKIKFKRVFVLVQFCLPLATVKCRQLKLKTKRTILNCLNDNEQNISCLVKGAVDFKIIKLVSLFIIIRKHAQSEDRLQPPK